MSIVLVHKSDDGIARVTLNRPDVLNALNGESRTKLTATFRELAQSEDVRAVVLQGSGRAFCAGQDQKETASFDADGAATRIDTYLELFDSLRRLYKPVVAKIRGYAVGAGMQLASLSDIRISSVDAKFGLTEFNVGSPCITGSSIHWKLAGSAAVRELVMSAQLITADKAFALGLVTEVVPEDQLDEHVDRYSERLAKHPAMAVKLTKEWWRELDEDQFRMTIERTRSSHATNFAAGTLTKGSTDFVGRER